MRPGGMDLLVTGGLSVAHVSTSSASLLQVLTYQRFARALNPIPLLMPPTLLETEKSQHLHSAQDWPIRPIISGCSLVGIKTR